MATINLRDMGESLSITPLRGLTTREHGAPEPELPGDARLVCTASNRSGPNSSRD
jgi:hypothetical protein